MIKYITILLLFINIIGFSQDEIKLPKRRQDGVMSRFTGLRAPKDTFVHKADRINLALFYNDWIGDKNNVKTKWHSIGFNFSFLYDQPFGANPVGIAIGLGFSHFQVHHNGQYSFLTDSTGGEYTRISPYPDSVSLKKNQFTANYIEIPFEFRIRTQGNVKFKLYLGFKAGIQTNAFGKWKTSDNKKFKEFNFPDKFLFRYGPTLRVGVNFFQLYAGFYFSKLFKDERSNELQTIELGMSFSLF